MSVIDDRILMRRCVSLADRGYGRVHPNPLVGCVVVKDGEIVGEGHHREYGAPHAEVEALTMAGKRAKGGTLYVNLEPCAHHGKTPPCAVAIVQAGVAEVIIGVKDPNPLVSGKGISLLKRAGIRVRTSVLKEESETLNERFLWYHRKGRPFVGLKWAQSIDGRSIDSAGRSQWITGASARAVAHRLRSGYDACLVGAGTVIADDPHLTVRSIPGRDPIRVVVDGKLRVSGRERIFDDRARTVLITDRNTLRRPSAVVRRLVRSGVTVLGLEGGSHMGPVEIVTALGGEGITSVLVEGGPRTISGFVEAKCVNKLHVFVGPMVLGDGTAGLTLSKKPYLVRSPLRLRRSGITPLEDGSVLLEGYPEGL